jgi:Tfp pilus assembly protein FimT
MMAIFIMGILALIAVDAIADSDANLRAERAAREAVAAIRFARSRAMSDTTTYKVRFNVAGKTISVVDPANSDAVLAAPIKGNTMLLSLTGNSDIAGVTMACSLSGDSADPYDITYTGLGGTANSGTVTFTYAGISKVLQIPNVGDPILVGDTRKP